MIIVKNYINGEWLVPDVTETIDVVNPATGELLAQTPVCNSDDVDCGCKGCH